jgi:hypothetical protein
MRIASLVLLALGITACEPPKKPKTSASTPNVLESTYAAKKLYLWNRRVRSTADENVWNSCWYYREALQADGFSERDIMLNSQLMTEKSIADGHIAEQLHTIVKEKLINAGIEIVPCGISAVSLYLAFNTAGLTLLASGITMAGTANTCIKNAYNIATLLNEFGGAQDGITSLARDETGMGKKFPARKTETDMFLNAIKRAQQRGYQALPKCPKPTEFKDEIMRKGMGDNK